MRRAIALVVLLNAIVLVARAQSTVARGVIAGRVLDDFGDPVIAARVMVEKRTAAGGVNIVATTTSDDRGDYRVPGLPADSFIISVATIGGLQTQTIGTELLWGPQSHRTYYPGGETVAEAVVLTLKSDDERTDVDFVVPAAWATTQPFSIAGTPAAMVLSPLVTGVPRTGTSMIRGRVVAADGHPLGRAQVGLILVGGARPTQDLARADGGGIFEFRDLPPGTYRVVASKPGYEPMGSDVPSPGVRTRGPSVTVAAGEVQDHLEITLAALATISGVVLDEHGDPLQGASVELLQIRYDAGRRQLVSADVRARVTDDLGRYRLYGLAAGDYLVSASIGSVSAADVAGYLRSYHPATSDPGGARFVSIRMSEAVVGIDITMERGGTARVAGTIVDHAGMPTTGGAVMLRPRQRSSAVGLSVGARLLAGGKFEFPNVPPGDYIVQANRGRSNSWTEGEFGVVPVSVNGTDVIDLRLQMSTGTSVFGVIRFDTVDPTQRPPASAIELSTVPVDFDDAPSNGLATANIRGDWQFQMVGLHGRRRLHLQRVPPGWALQAILVNGIEATDRPMAFGAQDSSLTDIEVVLTDRVSRLTGTVTDRDGRPAGGAAVFAVSDHRDDWYPSSRFLRAARAGADGTFLFEGLPASTYYITAVARPPQDDGWQDPAFLETLRSDVTIAISEGQQSSVSVRLLSR